MRGLAGAHVVVTGGTRGIGLATARRFLSEGSMVHICAADESDVAAAVAQLSEHGDVSGSACDVSHADDVAALARLLEEQWPGVDVLANNAGISWRQPFLELSVDEWDRLMAVNLRGVFLVGQAVATLMVAAGRGGTIINMASTNALGAEADYAHYNASKGGVLQLTRTMAVELAPHGIRVNALCPGYIDTPLNRQIVLDLGDPGFVDRYVADAIPIGRPGTEDDVAAAYAFLASSDASFITGATLVVDGGQTAVM